MNCTTIYMNGCTYLKSAFSAPRIWTVLAGYLARLVKLPACDMSLAPTCKSNKINSNAYNHTTVRINHKHVYMHVMSLL